MKEVAVTDSLLRGFILGQLTDEDRERIENLFLTDSPTRERVLVLEQDLIDDYLRDSLSEEEKERFLSRYAQTDEQRRQLRIIGAIRDWAVRESRASHTDASIGSVWSRFWTILRLNPRFIVPVTVTITIAVILTIVWLNSWTQRRERLAIEQELAQLNSPTNLRELPAELTSFDLKPVSLRSVEPQGELKIPAGIRIVELQLPWIQKERYSGYQAKVRRVGDRESFTIPNLQVGNNGPYSIRLRLPAQMLPRGHYQIELTGVTSDGPARSSEEYSFVVAP